MIRRDSQDCQLVDFKPAAATVTELNKLKRHPTYPYNHGSKTSAKHVETSLKARRSTPRRSGNDGGMPTCSGPHGVTFFNSGQPSASSGTGFSSGIAGLLIAFLAARATRAIRKVNAGRLSAQSEKLRN
jgi:hypothetical protein